MRFRQFKLFFLVCFLLIFFIPIFTQAFSDRGEKIEIPADVRALVPESDWIEMFCYMFKWKAGNTISVVETAESEKKNIEAKAQKLGMSITLPTFFDLKQRVQDQFDAICNASSVDEAINLMNGFGKIMEEIGSRFDRLVSLIQEQFKIKGEEIRNQMQEEIQREMESFSNEIEVMVNDELVAYQHELVKKWMSGLATEPSIEEQVAFRQEIEKVLEKKREEILSRYEAEYKKKAQESMEGIGFGAEFEEFANYVDGVGARIEAASQSQPTEALEYRHRALEKRKDITFTIVEKKIAEHIVELERHKDDLDELNKLDPSIPTYEEIIADIEADKAAFKDELSRAIEAEDEVAFKTAIENFRNKIESRGDSLEIKIKNAQLICSLAMEKVSEAKVEIQSALEEITQFREQCQKKKTAEVVECQNLKEHSEEILSFEDKMKELLVKIDDAKGLCGRVTQDTPADQVVDLFDSIKEEGNQLKVIGERLKSEFGEY